MTSLCGFNIDSPGAITGVPPFTTSDYGEWTLDSNFNVPDDASITTGRIPWDTASGGSLSGMNLTTGEFTAPSAGIYSVNALLRLGQTENGVGVARIVHVILGGNVNNGGSTINHVPRTSFQVNYSVTWVGHLALDEDLRIAMQQDSGGNLIVGSTGSRVRITKLFEV